MCATEVGANRRVAQSHHHRGHEAGTTSLHRYLGVHPDFHMSALKETDFFIEQRNWARGLRWYESHFASDAPVRGEASPSYTAYPRLRGVPERMAQVVPDAKLIYIVRDPIERIQSEYEHRRFRGERRPLEECLASLSSSPYAARSRYWMQLERYLRFFPSERILVVDQNDLLVRRSQQMREILGFSGVDPDFTSHAYATLHTRRFGAMRQTEGGRRAWMSAERGLGPTLVDRAHGLAVRAREAMLGKPIPRAQASKRLRTDLAAFLHDDVNALREHTGKRFDSWTV